MTSSVKKWIVKNGIEKEERNRGLCSSLLVLLQDVPLFEGIVQDLFPAEKDDMITMDPALGTAIQKTLEDNNLQVGHLIHCILY